MKVKILMEILKQYPKHWEVEFDEIKIIKTETQEVEDKFVDEIQEVEGTIP